MGQNLPKERYDTLSKNIVMQNGSVDKRIIKMSVYVIGQIRIIDQEKWNDYKSQVQSTLEPYGGKVLLRGTCIDSLVGTTDYPDVVAIEFDSVEKAKEWYHSSAYQSLVPIREKGAEIILQVYE